MLVGKDYTDLVSFNNLKLEAHLIKASTNTDSVVRAITCGGVETSHLELENLQGRDSPEVFKDVTRPDRNHNGLARVVWLHHACEI